MTTSAPTSDPATPVPVTADRRMADAAAVPTPRRTLLRLPTREDPRLRVLLLLGTYVALGITVLGFNRSPAQIALVVGAACVLDVTLHRLIHRSWLFPLSATITGLSLSILVNHAHGSLIALVPVFFAIASKYLVTFDGRHVFNPALFGIVAALVFGDRMLSVSPAYQWGGSVAMAAFIVTAALMIVAKRIRRGPLIVSFLLFYAVALAWRAWVTRHHVPPEVLFLGAVTSPAFYLFTFFMITDPASSPNGRAGQVLMAFVIVVVDLALHLHESLSTFFYAGFCYFALRWTWLHGHRCLARLRGVDGRVAEAGAGSLAAGASSSSVVPGARATTPLARRWGVIAALGLGGWLVVQQGPVAGPATDPGFRLVELSLEHTGLDARAGDVLTSVDPRLAHVAKWILSIGDAVAVADFDDDGLQDVFLSYPLKHADARAALYRNVGELRFERVPLPALSRALSDPATSGLPSGALWFDHDDDGDRDLFIAVGFGRSRLLANQLAESGAATFVDVGVSMGIDAYTTSVAANVLDHDGDGDLDLFVGNAASPTLRGYDEPVPFNVFALPEPAFDGDRRMFDIMHRTWHDAANGGENVFFVNEGDRFERADLAALGLGGTRWTIDVGTGDLDGDGRTDLYLANDFGPDELLVNRGGRFESVRGRFAGDIGRDTYKGMNASFADVDNNLASDIYVSNVHEPLQAEGSLLWMNDGTLGTRGWRAFADGATEAGALNPRRFGWGAALGDLDHDGRIDILQANGMVDDTYDKVVPDGSACPDYWYWNEKIALTGPDVHGHADRWADLRGRCIFPDEAKRVLLNRGGRFVDVAEAVGWGRPETSRGIALADLDNDGDLDVLVSRQFAPASVYRNDRSDETSATRHWLGLDLVGDGRDCNRDAVGTTVEFRHGSGDDAVRQLREVTASNGFSSQGDRRLNVGLDTYAGPVDVLVRWCGAREAEAYRLEADRYHRLEQARPGRAS